MDAARDDDLVDRCRQLFGEHYGVWGSNGPRPGERIRISSEHVLALLDTDASWIVCAYIDDDLVGYVVAVTFEIESVGAVAWVSQLVFHEAYRNARLGTILLRSIWEFTDYHAWGLATANPFAVRALEAATRRPVRRSVIVQQGPALVQHLASVVPYLPTTLVADDKGRPRTVLDTEFFVSHSQLSKMREQAARSDRPWNLDPVNEGEEWFACTFREQQPFPLTPAQWDAVLRSSEQAWVDAYERMTLDEGHRWHAHTGSECEWVLERVPASSPLCILDVGCGDGRHASELAALGHTVRGVDVSGALIARAVATDARATYQQLDARDELPNFDADVVLCLYDVLGSSPDEQDDHRILSNIRRTTKPGGRLVLSVMNEEPVRAALEPDHVPESYADFVEALDALPPSRTMQDTGNIHDPALLLMFENVYYRKEQFLTPGDRLPREVVVRHRRFHPASITGLVEANGFIVESLQPVQAGAWKREPGLDVTDTRAKELLLVCRRVEDDV